MINEAGNLLLDECMALYEAERDKNIVEAVMRLRALREIGEVASSQELIMLAASMSRIDALPRQADAKPRLKGGRKVA